MCIEAIDWILRVAGKDGGNGGDGAAGLAEAITELLKDIEGSVPEANKKAFEQVKQALDSGSGLIAKLAEGLQQFIGYNSSGKITGGGILPANVAKHQVCNAVLNFVIRFLEGLCGITVLGGNTNKEDVTKVIETLRKCVGSGQVPQGFGTLVEGIGGKVGKNSGFNGDVGSKLKEMFGKLKEIVNDHESGERVDDLQAFLEHVTKGSGSETSKDFKTLCDKLKTLFEDGKIKSGMTTTDKHIDLKSLNAIDPVTEFANKLNPSKFKTDLTKALATGVKSGAYAFLAEIKDPSQYTSFYKRVDNKDVNNVQCAKIFLGCLPLYYQALTYIYWGCHDNGGGWRNLTLAGGDLKSYFDSQGFLSPYVDRSKRGVHISGSALKGFQAEFTKGMEGATSVTTFPYASFATKLREKVNGSTSDYTDCPLSALYYGASCYFRYRQIATAKSAGGTPKTIREMLYFLAAFQFSPQYDAFDSYVTEYFKGLHPDLQDKDDDSELKLQVADSGLSTNRNTLSADQLKEYLRASCSFASSVLGMIQGPGANQNNSEPWLFELFCNSAFQFKYTSGAILFSTISNYAYALQFQLLFLYQQCSNNGVKCGWQECSYGRNVNKDSSGNSLQSHICPGFKCTDSRCTHTKGSNNCNHNNYNDQNNSCGKGSNPSPLQAFITGKLPSFNLSTSTTPNHMSDHPQSALCHTPMGFEAAHLRQDPGTGNYILSALRPICGDVSSPFRQLCEKLGCLTKRTPRTLADLFGFIWNLNGQMFNRSETHVTLQDAIQKSTTQTLRTFLTSLKALQPPSLLSNSLNKLTEVSFWNTPDSYGLASRLATNLFSLNQHCHKQEMDGKITHNTSTDGQGCTTSPNDLWSLCQPVRAKPTRGGSDTHAACRGKDCGPYLSPLTHSAGATYAPDHASVYLSWLTYLTDDFHEWFQSFLDEFKNIDCSRTGCRTSSSNSKCDKAHSAGTHGTSDACSCDSVVHCGGVLPVLYRHGFQFHSPHTLSGGKEGQDQTKRSCDMFHAQLSNVLSPDAPLAKLLESIDSFLYLFRFYFFYNQSAFWTIYICVILYTFFFLLDTLRVRSHLHFPSSNSIPPISLLGTGKAPALKKLTKLTYFIP
ncbi:variant erythrocyte surface antigen-1 family protein [Babesia caballi]|uniref:Variant erythrocyte surface antigen-1 family protein n=1 Tax=Babesia caballi TaxID=5871 RepID=A0AAV4LTG3_BABCB|nr:variant erythrocyte surface antigen-1 family protein [Babesia caballi]